MAKSAFRAGLQVVIELLVLLPSSMLVGYSIGTVQHYVAFGIWGYGFGENALQLATFEGGLIGALLGIPTGLLTFYAVLSRHRDSQIIAYTILGSLVGGCLLGALFFWPSAGLTPFLTIGLAAWLKKRRGSQGETSVA